MVKKLVLFSVYALLLILVIQVFNTQKTSAVINSDDPACSTTEVFVDLVRPFAGEVVFGQNVPLRAKVYATATGIQVQSVDFFAYQNASELALGSGNLSSGATWITTFDSQQYDNGVYNYFLRVKLDSSQEPCIFDTSRTFVIDNDSSGSSTSGTISDLKLTVLPSRTWSGYTYTPVSFNVQVKAVDNNGNTFDISGDPNIDYKWSLSGDGSIEGPDTEPFVDYWSGGRAGQATLEVRVDFNSLRKTALINISIDSPNTTSTATTYPETTSTEELDPTDPDYEKDLAELEKDNQDSPNSTNTTLAGNPVLASCIAKILGADRYQRLVEDGARLSLAELSRTASCFAVSNNILPPNLAPVEAKKEVIQQIERKARASIERPVEFSNDDDLDPEALLFKGAADPDQQILIYIFSEPLVLTTVADANGNWQYILENPLEPGEHEAYVVVEEEDGELSRSDPITFAVAQVPVSAANPNGLSLSLDDTEAGLINYLIVSASIVVAAGAVLYAVIRTRTLKLQLSKQSTGLPAVDGGQTVVGLGQRAEHPQPQHPSSLKIYEEPKPTVDGNSIDDSAEKHEEASQQ